EERRLMYVGVTRAKDRLYLVRAFRRTIWGRSEINEPSRFLRDIASVIKGAAANGGRREGGRRPSLDEDEAPARRMVASRPWSDATGGSGRRTLADVRPAESRGLASGARTSSTAASAAPESRPQFKAGERVSHGLFGEGIVLKVEPSNGDEEVTVAFAGKGTKTLLASFARLQKIP
ncbi:MAG: hypothetical protein N2439_05555, partial [Anaerolineae bacterium]|nr:hypothetical protein [Anaerolineae bacterium]